MKSVLLIGLGRFGRHIAMKLNEMNYEVLAVDVQEEEVNDILPYVTTALIGDSTNEKFIASLGVRNFDVCIVAIGDDFLSTLETTSLLKENGAKFVVARASRDTHAKFLRRNGADDVVYPEKQMAIWTAVRYGVERVLDYVELNREYSMFETELPHSWVGKNLIELQVRQKYKINVIAIKHMGEWEPTPDPNHKFEPGETVLIMGNQKNIVKFLQLD